MSKKGLLTKPSFRKLRGYAFDPSLSLRVETAGINDIEVKEDGTITNGRQFAMLFLTGNVMDRKARSTSADGMAGCHFYKGTIHLFAFCLV